MPRRYSRDVAVSAIRSFYQFFATLPSLPPEYIWEPPSDGWPEINGSTLAPLRKSKEVVDLLRHIPYINDVLIAKGTTVIDYTAETFSGTYDGNCLLEFGAGVIPDHVAVLTCGGKKGNWLLVDTQEGTVTEFNVLAKSERDFPPSGHPEHWRAYRTLPIVEFFESWKELYRNLEWIVLPGTEEGVVSGVDGATDKVREIYRLHGWPYEFRREECREALIDWKMSRSKKSVSKRR